MVLFSDYNVDNFFIGESYWFNYQMVQVINSLFDIGVDNIVIGVSVVILYGYQYCFKGVGYY